METTWTTNRRTDLTFSLLDAAEAELAAAGAMDACDELKIGFTLSAPAIGGWQGSREVARTLSFVGEFGERELSHIHAALVRAGCDAVQMEKWNGGGYCCREMREL